ncbi:MAG TPA: hypothetical protein VG497_30285 [Kribbella sp.]|nr:hypothetical protein [Kribbella sp.]
MVITVGVLTPHETPGPEIELPDLAAGQLQVVVSRAAQPEQAAAALPAVDVLAIASTGTGYSLGYDEESALVRRLHERWNVPVCATSMAAVEALQSHHVHRISLVHPPWFGQDLNDLGAAYFRSQGFEVVQAQLADLPDDPEHIQPAMVVDWVMQHLDPRAEAVFLGGNGFRAARAIDDLQRRTGRIVLTANQVLFRFINK